MSPGKALTEVVEENVVLRSVLREQRKLQSALLTMNGRLHSLLATVPGVLYSYHPDGRLEYISPSVAALLGHPARWFLGDASRYLDQVHRDDLGAFYHWRLQLLYAQAPAESQLRYRLMRPDGSHVDVLDRATVVFEGHEIARIDGLVVAVPAEAQSPEPSAAQASAAQRAGAEHAHAS
jgi:PAS domain-containing protein